jgi:hypothetical protein
MTAASFCAPAGILFPSKLDGSIDCFVIQGDSLESGLAAGLFPGAAAANKRLALPACPPPHAAKMNVVKMESPLGSTPNSAESSTIYAASSPPLYAHERSHPLYSLDASAVAADGAGGFRTRRGYDDYVDDDDGDDDDRALYSPASARSGVRLVDGHQRSLSNGNSSVVSSGLGIHSVGDDRDSSTASPTTTDGQPQKKKQKRNKPTLSCFECVERKTKACHVYVFICACSVTPSLRRSRRKPSRVRLLTSLGIPSHPIPSFCSNPFLFNTDTTGFGCWQPDPN